MIRHRAGRFTATAVALLVVAGLAACTEDDQQGSGGDDTTTTVASSCDPADLIACAKETTLEDVVPDEPTKASGEPITLGMINQVNTPAGSFPELNEADEALVAFINEELGGIGGRPLALDVCDTGFSAEGSQKCAQDFVQKGYPAVLGGIDIFGNGIDVLTDNGIPFVGGIPVSTQSVQSPISFQFSGGSWGAAVAFADYAVKELKAKKVSVIYGEFGSIQEAAEYGIKVLEKAGVEVTAVPFPIISTDLLPPLQTANANDPDAIIVLAADTGCGSAYNAAASLGIEAQMFYVGACAAPKILAEAGVEKTDGSIYNVEGPVDQENPDPDVALYNEVLGKYAPGLDPQGAGTVSFRALANLYVILHELGPDGVTPAAITKALEATKDQPSFNGYPYTCDGKQFEGLPAICAPEQILAQRKGTDFVQITDWILVGEIYAAANA